MVNLGISISPGLDWVPDRDTMADRRTERITIANTRLAYLLSCVKTYSETIA